MDKKEVLLISATEGILGGVEIFLLEWVKGADKTRFSFIWYYPGRIADENFIREWKEIGVQVIEGRRINSWSKNPSFRGRLAEKRRILGDIYDILKNRKIDIIHIHDGHPTWQTLILPMAAACKIKNRIWHGHNTTGSLPLLRRLEEAVGKKIITVCGTSYAACSRQAAEYFFGRKATSQTIIVKNCIETKKFVFSQEIRDRCRSQNKLDDKFVIGHVGRFSPQKNHGFLIDIFRLTIEQEPNARLMLIGEGPLECQIREKVKKYNLSDKVIFIGATKSVRDYMCAMDVFALPSLYEGFGIVNIEAQANGLPCIISDVVPEEAAITNLVQYVPLEAGAEYWAGRILEYKDFSDIDARCHAYKKIRDAGYDVGEIPKDVLRLYS